MKSVISCKRLEDRDLISHTAVSQVPKMCLLYSRYLNVLYDLKDL